MSAPLDARNTAAAAISCGIGEASGRNALLQLLSARVIPGLSSELGQNHGRRNRIDGYAVFAPFGGERLGKADDAEFRGAIGHVLVDRDRAGLRGDIDDLAALAGLDHDPADSLRDEERSLEIDVDGSVPGLQGEILGGGEHGDTGAVDDDVDMAEGRLRRSDDGFHRLRVGNVADEGFRAISECVGFGFRDRFIDVDHADDRALGGKCRCDGIADAGSAARYQGDLAAQRKIQINLF